MYSVLYVDDEPELLEIERIYLQKILEFMCNNSIFSARGIIIPEHFNF